MNISIGHQRLALTLTLFAGWILPASSLTASEDFAKPLAGFLQEYCNDCHADGSAEGGLAIDTLGRDLSDPATFAKWERLFDRVELHEMPPADMDQPSAAQRRDFLDSLRAPLVDAHAAAKGTVLRRLNRREYENTLNDLFGTHLDLESLLPEDGRSHEFDNIGEALNISMVQLQRYLEAIDSVLDASIAKTNEAPPTNRKRATYAETREGERHIGKVWKQLDDGAVVFFKAFGYPSGMLRTANVREAGRYRISVTGYAYQSDQPITFAIGATSFQRGSERPTFAYRALPPGEPSTVEIEAWIDANYMIELTPWGIADLDNEIRLNGLESYRGPGLAILQVDLEGPLRDEFPSRGHRLLFNGLKRVEVPPPNPNDKKKPWYVPKFSIESQDPNGDAKRVLTRVATAAFRRPAQAQDVQPFLDLLVRHREQGASMEDSLRTAVAAIFCSPDFLYLREPPGWLDDYALAARLSFFLTRSTPDEQLLEAAASGRLTKHPDVLLAQTLRLLKTAHHERFINDFTDAWLNLRDIEFTAPDKNLFPEFDEFLQDSMLKETRSFFASLIADNAGVRELIDSDYAMLNNRLAQHYEIGGVTGPEIRRVPLPHDSVRGGILAQASILKVSANGTNTSPVVRGVWVMERIMGQAPPPPPAGVPGVEPDIRGASTLRELLDKHRNLDSCRGCHLMIDPPGFALESFNPIGGWRTHFRSLGNGERVEVRVGGRQVRYRIGPEVDASGMLADGTEFSGFREFREILARDEAALARALATKLLTFATGREMGFSDRQSIEEIVQQSKASGYGIRDLIESVVLSETFRKK
jgi:hypothetical protein